MDREEKLLIKILIIFTLFFIIPNIIYLEKVKFSWQFNT